MKRDIINWLSWSVSSVTTLAACVHAAAILEKPIPAALLGTFALMCAFLAGCCFQSAVNQLDEK